MPAQNNNILTKKDKELLRDIEKQLKNGDTTLYDSIFNKEYWEVPVDYWTFITDKRYLGKTWVNEDGTLSLWEPYQERAKNIVKNGRKRLTIARGGTGIGKTKAVQVTDWLYDLYTLMCLKDPVNYFGLGGNTQIFCIAINPLGMQAAEKNSWGVAMRVIEDSPWFMEHGQMRGNIHKKYYPYNKALGVSWGSTAAYITGLDPFSIMYDEISEQTGNARQQRDKAMKLITAGAERQASRFPDKEGVYLRPRMSLASSEKTEQAFIHDYCQKQIENGNQDIEIIKGPRWDFEPTLKGLMKKGKVFYVAMGDMTMPNEVIGRNKEDCQKYIDLGYSIMEVPDDPAIYKSFLDDIDLAFTNVAGITVSNSMKYISPQLWNKCIDENAPRPFKKETYKVGIKDSIQYIDLMDLTQVPKELMRKKWFLRFDIAYANTKGTNRCGIGMDTIESVEKLENGEFKVNYFGLFHIGIEAPEGDKMSFQKHRQFIRDLKKAGFKLHTVSSDLRLMSADMAEQMIAEGFNFVYRSVDVVKKVGSDKIQQEWAVAKSIIHEGRYRHHPHKLLTDEIRGLVRDAQTGTIDHSAEGVNSKDCADTLAGNLAIASEHVSEFVNEFGISDVQRIVQANTGKKLPVKKKEISIEERKRMMEKATQEVMRESMNKAIIRQGKEIEKPKIRRNDTTRNHKRRFIY